MSTYQFTTDHPPLLRDLGYGAISNIQESKGPEHRHQMNFMIKIYGPNGWPLFIPGTLTKQKVWVRQGPVERLSGRRTVTITQTLSQSYTELETLRKLVSTTIGGSYGPVSAEITGEIEKTKSYTKTWSSSRTHTRQEERDGQQIYADWLLIDRINIDYDLSHFRQSPPAMKKELQKALENLRKYETLIGTFDDNVPDFSANSEVEMVSLPQGAISEPVMANGLV